MVGDFLYECWSAGSWEPAGVNAGDSLGKKGVLGRILMHGEFQWFLVFCGFY